MNGLWGSRDEFIRVEDFNQLALMHTIVDIETVDTSRYNKKKLHFKVKIYQP